MKLNTVSLSKKILLAFIGFSILAAASALSLHFSTCAKMKHLSKLSDGVVLDQSGADHAMLLLRQAEDYFQESFLEQYSKKNAEHIAAYEKKLLQAFTEIDLIIKKKPDTAGVSREQAHEMWNWYRKKLQLSHKLQLIKYSFDFFLTAALNSNLENRALTVTDLHFHVPETFENYIDTVRNIKSNEKRAFFGRIKDAIVNKDTDKRESLVINNNRISKIVDSVTKKIIVNDKNVYEQRLKQLQKASIKVMGAQKKLIAVNYEISDNLESIINDAKEINHKMETELKYSAFKNLNEIAQRTNEFFIIAIFLALIFAFLLVTFLVKLNQSEVILRLENERSIIMAKQKMDLLLYMSHEVRNPLTAIKSFLHVFSKTDLSAEQKEILESIRLSSEMLLNTLSDTLDAAKMESSEFKINSAPFIPHIVFGELIEGLGYGAVKKNLKIEYDFKGDKDAIVLGDPLRLKQILYNLLSNAIKFTTVGGIIIKVNLLLIRGNYILYVDIIDTGEGISYEQQVNLFSKYHQTNSALGKIGTGLGLYLCKLLVEMQEGQISVTSEVDKGSTFSFYIPYE